MSKKEDIRAYISRPGEGQTEQESGWSGFQPASKFTDQGSLPYDGNDLEFPTRSGMGKGPAVREVPIQP
jgi:hypothetical protein